MARRLARLSALIVAALAAAALAPSAMAARGPCIPGTNAPKCFVWTGKVGPVDDGDTINARINGLGGREWKIRLTGIQAMELTQYGRRAGRKGECNAVKAAERLEQLIRRSRSVVRIAAHKKSSTTGERGRLRRHISVRHRGRWVDAGAVLIQEGLALWFPNAVEWAWNRSYSRLQEAAARRGRNIWDPQACGAGPSAGSALRLKVKWDAEDNDAKNINGEWVRITNTDLLNDVPLRGWWFRDSHLRRYTFPAGVVPANGSIRLHIGRGSNDANTFYWGLNESVFENATNDSKQIGDGGYLFDDQGDLRASAQYPCRTSCTDPLEGTVTIHATPRGEEFVTLRNNSSELVNLFEYEVESVPWFYEFGRNDTLLPRQSLRLYINRAPGSLDGLGGGLGVLVGHSWGHRDPLLADRQDAVTFRSPTGRPISCDSWGGVRCPGV